MAIVHTTLQAHHDIQRRRNHARAAASARCAFWKSNELAMCCSQMMKVNLIAARAEPNPWQLLTARKLPVLLADEALQGPLRAAQREQHTPSLRQRNQGRTEVAGGTPVQQGCMRRHTNSGRRQQQQAHLHKYEGRQRHQWLWQTRYHRPERSHEQ